MDRINKLKDLLRYINFDKLTLKDYKIALEYLNLKKINK